MQFSKLNLCSLTLACSGSLWASLLYCLLQVRIYIEQICPELCLLWAEQSWLSLSPCAVHFTCSNISTSHQCCVEGKHHLPWPAGNNLPHAAQAAAILLYFRGVLLAYSPWSCPTWCSPRAPDLFLQSCFPVEIAPSLNWCMRLFLPRTEHFPLDFIKLSLTHLSSLSRFIWMKRKHLLYHPSC